MKNSMRSNKARITRHELISPASPRSYKPFLKRLKGGLRKRCTPVGNMAIFKATFIKNNARKIAAGKAHIRYIQNRRGKDGEKITRTLFNADGAMGRWEAYRMIDEAESRSVMYRLVINFDAEKE